MSTKKLPVNFKYKYEQNSTKMVPSKQEKQN